MMRRFDNVPAGLRGYRNWVVWRYEPADSSERRKKVPYSPRSPQRKASVTDRDSWETFDEAVSAAPQDDVDGGIGFVFTADDPFCCYDLDGCITDGETHPAAAELLERIVAYKEPSPSGTGMHAIFEAEHNGHPNRTGNTPWGGGFECYDRGRFLTITGGGVGAPKRQQSQHDTIVAELLPAPPQQRETQEGVTVVVVGNTGGGNGHNLDDAELLRRAFRAKNGAKIKALYDGDLSEHGDDQNRADLALCRHLGFYTGPDPDRIDALFRGSKLYREKWEREDYRSSTIEKALAGLTEFYTPRDGAGKAAGRNGHVRLELPAPTAPMDVARRLIAEQHTHPDGTPLLHHWRDSWWRWKGSHWAELGDRGTRAAAYKFTEHAAYAAGDETKPWAPNRRKVGDLVDAAAACSHLPDHITPPAWLDDSEHQGVIVACANGLLDISSRRLLPHNPSYFNQAAVPFDYDANAPEPERWLVFLHQLWGDDEESIAALQEWFGYVISGRTDMHKIHLLTGPTRSGKGTIARILTALIGEENVAGPTLSSLTEHFGLQVLVGKSLAVISDARLGGRGHNVVVERLLSISGEDVIYVDRKNRDGFNAPLPVRIMIVSNELPQLGDASAAIADRFDPVLKLKRSWLNKEDRSIEGDLKRNELPGIFNWSLKGRDRLIQNGHFTRTPRTDELRGQLRDLASPIGEFVRECCQVGASRAVAIADLWPVYREWAEENGQGKPGSKAKFSRDLSAAVPGLRTTRPEGDDGSRPRKYVGLGLKRQPASSSSSELF